MKLIIAGARDYQLTDDDFAKLNMIENVTEVVSGTCRGVDQCGEFWAETHNIPIKRFPADWKTFGRAAGPIRNKQMAEYADAVVLFHPDKNNSRGTASMYRIAKKENLQIFDFRK